MKYQKLAGKIERHYASQGVPLAVKRCEVIGDDERYILQIKLKPGTKEKQFFDCASDVQLALQLPMFQPFREGLSLCLAVSDQPIMECSLPKMLGSRLFQLSRMYIPIALGCDMRGIAHFIDLVEIIHALLGGATNSGKTEGLRSTILSIVVKQPVSKVNLLIFDTGASGLDLFGSLPHLSHPIIKEPETAILAMLALLTEMERRIALPIEELRELPAIVCVVDEYISLINSLEEIGDSKGLTSSILSLLRRGRHAKIHVILATQEAAKQDMKINLNNLNARMAFTCSDFYNSRSILGEGGAENLPGNGAMLYKSAKSPKPILLQGAYMPTEEIEVLITRITSASHDLHNRFVISENDFVEPPTSVAAVLPTRPSATRIHEKELCNIILWTLGRKTIAADNIERFFHMGRRAAGIVDELFQKGLITGKNHNQPRKVIPQTVEEIPSIVMELLTQNGVPENDIAVAIQSRSVD